MSNSVFPITPCEAGGVIDPRIPSEVIVAFNTLLKSGMRHITQGELTSLDKKNKVVPWIIASELNMDAVASVFEDAGWSVGCYKPEKEDAFTFAFM